MSEADDDQEKVSFSLIKIDSSGLTEPGKLLIERISNALGGIFEPMQIRRVAEANADAAAAAAKGEVRVTDIQRRAAKRWLAEEERRQRNMEAILATAAPQVNPKANPENIEEDWLANFLQKSRETSDEQLQALWAKILAGEANAPGMFGKRTVNLVASLEKSDADKFSALCGFICNGLGSVGVMPLIFDPQAKIYKDNELTWASLKHLDDIGLVSFESIGGLQLNLAGEKPTPQNWMQGLFFISYHGSHCVVKPNDLKLPIGHVKFTKAGSDLARITESKVVPGFLEYLVSELSKSAVVQQLKSGEKIHAETFYPNGFN